MGSWRAARGRGELALDPASEGWVGADHERACSQLVQGCNDRLEVAFVARVQDMEREPARAGRVRIARLALGVGISRVDQQAILVALGTSSCSSARRFGASSCAQVAHAREVAAGPIQAGDKAEFDRVEAHEEYDRNGGGGRLGLRALQSCPRAWR